MTHRNYYVKLSYLRLDERADNNYTLSRNFGDHCEHAQPRLQEGE